MTWPTTRLTTYAAGSQIKSADLDAIQDAIIGQKHGTRTKYINAANGQFQASAEDVISTAGGWTCQTDDDYCLIPIPDDANVVGKRLLAVVLNLTTGSTSGTRSLMLQSTALDGTGATVESSASGTSVSSNYTISLGSSIPFTIGDSRVYMLLVRLKATDKLNSVKFQYDSP